MPAPSQRISLISVIDDDESIRDAIVGLVHWMGLRVNAFSSALEFLTSADLTDNSCIIADVQMPQMTGIELYYRLRELGYSIPTILITAYPDDETEARALADGVICYLGKPFGMDDLIGCIRSTLPSPVGPAAI